MCDEESSPALFCHASWFYLWVIVTTMSLDYEGDATGS